MYAIPPDARRGSRMMCEGAPAILPEHPLAPMLVFSPREAGLIVAHDFSRRPSNNAPRRRQNSMRSGSLSSPSP